jgi:hypothetical protein
MKYIESAICLEFYDGCTEGVARARDGGEYLLSTLWSSWSTMLNWNGADASPLRIFSLSPVVAGSFNRLKETVARFDKLYPFDPECHVIMFADLQGPARTEASNCVDTLVNEFARGASPSQILFASGITDDPQLVGEIGSVLNLIFAHLQNEEPTALELWTSIAGELNLRRHT